MKQKTLINFLLSLVVAACCVSHAAYASTEKPNIIVIMVDDMGYGGLSCYDNKFYETPEIDRMAAEGLQLMDFHSNGAVCSPTRAAFLTGRYQQRTGCDGVVNADPEHPMHQRGLVQAEWTFAEAMGSAGYVTGMFGKWHLGYKPEFHPMNHGFDEFSGFISGNIDAHSHYDRMKFFDWWQGREKRDEPGYHTDLITEHALDFIERHKDEPFFLYLPHGAPHSPHQARGSAIRRGPNRGTIPEWAPKETYSNDAESEDWLMRHFILPVDEGVGRIRAKLEALNLSENTIVWFFSDNGGTGKNGTLSKRLKAAKGSVYEGGHRVPCLVWAPGRIQPGTVSDELVLSFDVMPTSMALAGATAPAGHQLDGMNVSSALFDGQSLPKHKRYWAMGAHGAVRDGVWKLVLSAREGSAGKPQLFNLQDDLGETKNLASEYPERVTQLSGLWRAWYTEVMSSSPYSD